MHSTVTVSCKVDALNHICNANAADDHGWPLIDVGIPDGTGLIITAVTGTNQLAA
jgi:hypothetical protein